MILNKLKILKKKFNSFNIDGYVVPKNDEFFSEYSEKNEDSPKNNTNDKSKTKKKKEDEIEDADFEVVD